MTIEPLLDRLEGTVQEMSNRLSNLEGAVQEMSLRLSSIDTRLDRR